MRIVLKNKIFGIIVTFSLSLVSLCFVGSPLLSLVIIVIMFFFIVFTNKDILVRSGLFKLSLGFFIFLLYIFEGDILMSGYILFLILLGLIFLNTFLYFYSENKWDFYTLFVQFFLWLNLIVIILATVKFFFLQCINDLISKDLLHNIDFQNPNLQIYFSFMNHYSDSMFSEKTIIVIHFDNLNNVSFWVDQLFKTESSLAINWVAPYLNKIFLLNKAISAHITLIIK